MNLSEANQNESYHDYMRRKLKEENSKVVKTVDQRDEQISDLKYRIKKLEEDMARILHRHE